jgi:hypothetical protein
MSATMAKIDNSFDGKRVFITGADGFIGSHLAEALWRFIILSALPAGSMKSAMNCALICASSSAMCAMGCKCAALPKAVM